MLYCIAVPQEMKKKSKPIVSNNLLYRHLIEI